MWELVDLPEPLEPVKRYGNRGIPSAQCGCGRFAKFLGYRHGYNGRYTTEHLKVDCSRCGVNEHQLV